MTIVHFIVIAVIVPVGDGDVRLHQISERPTGLCQHNRHVGERLLGLGPHVARPDPVAVAVLCREAA
jgi:hypothetical protein